MEIDHRQLASGVWDIPPQADVHLWTRNLVKLMHSCSAAVKNYAKLLITEMLSFHISSEIQQFLCFVRQKYTFLWLNVCLQTGHVCFGGLSGPWGLLWPFRTFETWRFASTALFILPFTLKNKVNVTFCLIYLVVMQYCLVFVTLCSKSALTKL